MADFNVLGKYEVSMNNGDIVCRKPIGKICGDCPDGEQIVFGAVYGHTKAAIIDDVLVLGKTSIMRFNQEQFLSDMKLDLSKLPRWTGSKYVVLDADREKPIVLYAQSDKSVPRKKVRRILSKLIRAGAIQQPAEVKVELLEAAAA